MDTITAIFQAVTNTIPTLTARIIWQFLQYPIAPYARTRVTYSIIKGNKIDGVSIIIIVYFAFALMLGIPTTRRYILSFDDGLEQSIARLDAVDTKGKEFFYLLIFVFALTIMTLLVVEFVRHRYNYGNKAKKRILSGCIPYLSLLR